MSRDNFTARQIYTGAGNLADYDFDFKIESLDQLLVIVIDASGNEIERVRGTDTTYLDSVDYDSDEGGGTVHLLANLQTGYKIGLFLANDAPTQPKEFKSKRNFSMSNIESALDFLAGEIQRVAWLAQRAIRLNDMSEDAFEPQLPIAPEGNRVLQFSSDGLSIIEGPTEAELLDAIAAAAAAAISEANAAAAAVAAATSASAAAAAAAAAAVSAAFLTSGPFTVPVNTNANLAGEIFDHTVYKRIDFIANIVRGTGIFNSYEFSIVYRNGGWVLIDRGESWDDAGLASGVTFTVDGPTGQVNAAVANDGGSNAQIDLKKLYWAA
jgi:hypothetical protein